MKEWCVKFQKLYRVLLTAIPILFCKKPLTNAFKTRLACPARPSRVLQNCISFKALIARLPIVNTAGKNSALRLHFPQFKKEKPSTCPSNRTNTAIYKRLKLKSKPKEKRSSNPTSERAQLQMKWALTRAISKIKRIWIITTSRMNKTWLRSLSLYNPKWPSTFIFANSAISKYTVLSAQSSSTKTTRASTHWETQSII